MMERRPDSARVVKCVEEFKGELGGMSFEDGMVMADSELARRAGLNCDAAVSMALRRYAWWLARVSKEQSKSEKASQLLIVRS